MFPHKIEDRLLIACIRIDSNLQTIRALTNSNLDWARFLTRASQLGIAPMVYSWLKSIAADNEIPQWVMKQLQQWYSISAIKNMNLYLKLKEVLEVFLKHSIPIIILKGSALAPLVYNDLAIRPMVDLDLLVPENKLDAADLLLQQLHYTPVETLRSKEWYRNQHHHLIPYKAPDQSLVIEIHRHITPPWVSNITPIEEFWQRAQPVQIASMTPLILSPEDLLLHTIIHLSQVDGFVGKIRALCDIAEIVKRYKSEIDWEGLTDYTKRYGIERYVYYALWLAWDIVGAEIPISVFDDFTAGDKASYVEDAFLRFLLRRAVLYAEVQSIMPQWVIYEMCTELLNPHAPLAKKLWNFIVKFYDNLIYSASQRVPHLYRLGPLITLVVYPLYLALRAALNLIRAKRRLPHL
jgi:hypothetical protein